MVRHAVVDALAKPGVRVAVVTAPGGYGKTSHVASWATGDPRALAWLTLEENDNDPSALFARLVDELARVTDVDPAAVSVHGLLPRQYATVAASRLRRALATASSSFVLVLDDTHLIETEAAIDLLEVLVSAVPAGSELVLVGRGPRLDSVIRRGADSDMCEITLDDLAMGEQEATLVLQSLGVDAPPSVVASIVAETEGWPVGIRLAGLQMLHDLGGDAGLRPKPIAHVPAIAEYVWSQWLSTSSAADVEFLVQASVLTSLSASVCDHVLERRDSEAVLLRLLDDRRAVIPLANHFHFFRLHRLLQDVLLDELHRAHPEVERRLHLRASCFYEAAGDDGAAVHHAIAAGDLARAERLVLSAFPRRYTVGRSVSVQRWLAEFPPGHVQRRPMLCVAAGVTCLGHGDGDGAGAWAEFAECALDRLDEAAAPAERAFFLIFRAMVRRGTISASLSDAATGVRDLPPGTLHGAARLVHGSLSWMVGDFETAYAMLTQAVAEARASDAPSIETMARSRLALVHLARGQVPEAHLQAREARDLQRAHCLDQMPTLHIVPAVTALLAAADGAPDVAREEARLARGNLSYFDGVAPWVSVPTRIVLAETAVLLGDRATAGQLINEARALLDVATDATHAMNRCDALADLVREAGESLVPRTSILTTAELRVLHFLPTNLKLQEIASRLYLSRWTVKSHASSIYRKLGARNRSQAVALAREAGLLADDSTV